MATLWDPWNKPINSTCVTSNNELIQTQYSLILQWFFCKFLGGFSEGEVSGNLFCTSLTILCGCYQQLQNLKANKLFFQTDWLMSRLVHHTDFIWCTWKWPLGHNIRKWSCIHKIMVAEAPTSSTNIVVLTPLLSLMLISAPFLVRYCTVELQPSLATTWRGVH